MIQNSCPRACGTQLQLCGALSTRSDELCCSAEILSGEPLELPSAFPAAELPAVRSDVAQMDELHLEIWGILGICVT